MGFPSQLAAIGFNDFILIQFVKTFFHFLIAFTVFKFFNRIIYRDFLVPVSIFARLLGSNLEF